MGRMKESYYVWQISERNEAIKVVCPKCEYQAKIFTKSLAGRLQEKDVLSLSFKCTKCGTKTSKPTADP